MNLKSALLFAVILGPIMAAQTLCAQEHRDDHESHGHGHERHVAVRHQAHPRAVRRAGPPAYHAAILRNAAFMRGVRAHEGAEGIRGHYYWHTEHGIRYAHFVDLHGMHWYGFYHGRDFYWTRYWGNRWWWFDGGFHRWVYWWNGYWWWTGPHGVAYVYIGNDFVPYQAGMAVAAPAPAPVPVRAGGRGSISPDGSRFVQITGPNAEAFLYDQSSGQPVYMKYLGAGVQNVRYSGGGETGAPLQILANFRNGSFAVYDGNGNPLQSPGASPAATTAASSTAPVPPTAAPGAATQAMPTSAPPPLEGTPPAEGEQPPSAPDASSGSAPAGGDQPPSAPPGAP